MLDKSDIILRLQSGDTLDDIAADLTAALNEANEEFKALQEEKAKREAAIKAENAEKERVAAAKREAVLMMIDAACDYLVAAGEDELLNEMHEIDADELVRTIDSLIVTTHKLNDLKNTEFDISPLLSFFM